MGCMRGCGLRRIGGGNEQRSWKVARRPWTKGRRARPQLAEPLGPGMSQKYGNWKWTSDGSVDLSAVARQLSELHDKKKIRRYAVRPAASASTATDADLFINIKDGRAQAPTNLSDDLSSLLANGSWQSIATIDELNAAQNYLGFIGPRSKQGKRTDRDLKEVDLDELADCLLGDDGPPSTPSGESSTRGHDGPPPKVARPPSRPSGESSTASDFGCFDCNGNAVATEVAMGELEARLDVDTEYCTHSI